MKYPEILIKVAEMNGEDLNSMSEKEVVEWADWLCYVISHYEDSEIAEEFTDEEFTELKEFVENTKKR